MCVCCYRTAIHRIADARMRKCDDQIRMGIDKQSVWFRIQPKTQMQEMLFDEWRKLQQNCEFRRKKKSKCTQLTYFDWFDYWYRSSLTDKECIRKYSNEMEHTHTQCRMQRERSKNSNEKNALVERRLQHFCISHSMQIFDALQRGRSSHSQTHRQTNPISFIEFSF